MTRHVLRMVVITILMLACIFLPYTPGDYDVLSVTLSTSHDTDLLRLSQEDLNRQRGYISIHQLPQSHWKSFWFD